MFPGADPERNILEHWLIAVIRKRHIFKLDFPGKYGELAGQFKTIISSEFGKYGLELVDFYISSITPPDDVARLIDERSGMGAVGDVDKFLKFEMARGLGSSGLASATGSSMGMAAGVGLMVPHISARFLACARCRSCSVRCCSGRRFWRSAMASPANRTRKTV
jgi:membrane protease subunit (stomatin/prohibitin family)